MKLKPCFQFLSTLYSSSKVKATPEKVRSMLKLLGMDFSSLDKCKAYQNSKDKKKLATTPVWIIKHVSYDYLYQTLIPLNVTINMFCRVYLHISAAGQGRECYKFPAKSSWYDYWCSLVTYGGVRQKVK